MSSRLSEIEARLRALEEAVAGQSIRLSAIERGTPGDDRTSPALVHANDVHSARASMAGALPLLGRTFIVLAGAFLLRALSESGFVPGRTGAVLGLAYAAVWLGAADRYPGSPSSMSRLLHGLAAVAIGLPLLWEATTRFQFFSAATAAATLGLLSVIALAVAWDRQLQVLAGLATVGAAALAPSLAIATDATGPFALAAMGVVAATWLLGETRGWRWLAWPAGLAEILLAARLTARALRQPPLESPGVVIGVLGLLLAVATAPFVIRALRQTAGARVFDAVQALVAVPICLVGLVAGAGQITSAGVAALGVVMVVAGTGLYGLGFARVLPHQGAGRNFYTATSVALAYLVVGASQLLSEPAASLVFAGLAVAAVWGSDRLGSAAIALHAALLALVAAIGSGLFTATAGVWLVTPDRWPALSVSSGLVLMAIVGAALLGATWSTSKPAWLAATGRVTLNALALVQVGGAVLLWLGPTVAGTPARMTSMRTGVLSVAALLLAAVGRRTRWREFGWLVYPVLLAGGIQLAVGGFAVATAATLFVALAMYGVALVIASRLMRRA
ncbi:MAG TPA: hypothetical protein VJN96_04955 [Vicinamibacterales bacterium]|nr:hypothetical protein [Vicinamibacterales bacterium]